MAEIMEKSRRSLDGSLSVVRWKVAQNTPDTEDDRDPSAPDWWIDDEDASQSFLSEQGFIL